MSESNIDLAACPFCNGNAEFRRIENRDGVANVGGEFIECTKCGACTNIVFSVMEPAKAQLLDRWNRRTVGKKDVWPGDITNKLVVHIWHCEEEDILIGMNGHITSHVFKQLEKDLMERECGGPWGEYLLNATWNHGMRESYGQNEVAPYWAFDEIARRPFSDAT